MKRNLKKIAVFAALAQSFLWSAAAQQIDLRWNELSQRVGDSKVSMALPGGAYIEGRILAVQADGLRMKVTKSSDKHAQPKGEHLISRQSVSVLHMTNYRKVGRIALSLGSAGAVVGIALLARPTLHEGYGIIAVPAGIAAGTVGAAVGGYYVGKRIDRREIVIRIVPDADQPR